MIPLDKVMVRMHLFLGWWPKPSCWKTTSAWAHRQKRHKKLHDCPWHADPTHNWHKLIQHRLRSFRRRLKYIQSGNEVPSLKRDYSHTKVWHIGITTPQCQEYPGSRWRIRYCRRPIRREADCMVWSTWKMGRRTQRSLGWVINMQCFTRIEFWHRGW